MPTVTLNKTVFEKLVGKKLPIEKLKDRISYLGTDLESIEGNNINVEIFPNRPDMLSEQGFARAFSSFIGVKKGLRNFPVKKSGETCLVKKPLKMWPYVVTAIVKGLKLNDERIREIIQLQEKLGITLLRDRKKGGIGLYPLEKIQFPITFTTQKAEDIKFRPLEYPSIISGRDILSRHPTGRKYSHIIEKEKEFPVFIDANNTIMSMPPIINAHDVGKITETTKDVFIEATGTNLKVLKTAMNIVVTSLFDMDGTIYTMDIKQKGKNLITPDLKPKEMKIDLDYVNKQLGLTLKETDLKKYLGRMGFGYKNKKASIPAYRADILHLVDLIEDIAIAYGYENFEPEIPKIATIGEENKFESFKSKIATLLVGLNILETNSYHLINKDTQTAKMEQKQDCIELANSLSEEHNSLRAWIIPSLLSVLATNKHHEYPQNIFELGTTFTKNKTTESLTEEHDHLAIALCHEKTDFTKIKQILDYVFKTIGTSYELKDDQHASFIKGRVGKILVHNEEIGFLGELSPKVITNFSIAYPIATLELNITKLFELLQQ